MTEEQIKDYVSKNCCDLCDNRKWCSIRNECFVVNAITETTKELQEENGKLLQRIEQLEKDVTENESDCSICDFPKLKTDLEKQIEKMKCCNNCKHRYFMDFKSVCAFDKSDIKDIENPITCKCNKWEIEG